VLASECSSLYNSGWTLYLEHSFLSPNSWFIEKMVLVMSIKAYKRAVEDAEEEEEEDLSMVSDASSGPPTNHMFITKFLKQLMYFFLPLAF
jgi:hypothetical protein